MVGFYLLCGGKGIRLGALLSESVANVKVTIKILGYTLKNFTTIITQIFLVSLRFWKIGNFKEQPSKHPFIPN